MELDSIQELLDPSTSIAEQQSEVSSYKERSTFLLAMLRFAETIRKERKITLNLGSEKTIGRFVYDTLN